MTHTTLAISTQDSGLRTQDLNNSNVTVIKLGGSLLDDPVRREAALRAIANAWKRGEEVVLVHGGGKHVDAKLQLLGIATKTHAGLRITDDATLDVVVSVLAGTVNKLLVSELAKLGVQAAGFSGADASTLVAVPHPPIDGVEFGHVGQVVDANDILINALLNSRVMPVISSVAQGPDGTLLNVNADSAASAIAVATNATALHFITDVAGLLDASGQVLDFIDHTTAASLIESGVVAGGMRPKILAALNAIEAGVSLVAIGDTIHHGQGGTHLVAA